MGCATSRLGPTVAHVPEAAALPLRIRRRLDSIRRRRRVADSFITAGKETPSLSKKLLLEATDDSEKLDSSPDSSRDLDQEMVNMYEEEEEDAPPNNYSMTKLERERADCIIEAVKRAIDDVILEDEESAGDDYDDAGRRVVARGKDNDDDGELNCFGSPSFRVYCAAPKPFGSFASIDFEVKGVEDVPKANHEKKESIERQPTPIPDKESSTGKSKLGRKYELGEETNNKLAGSCRKRGGGALGMKMLLNLACYSCAAHPDRTRIVQN